jgi:hypothetical protein
MGQLDNFIIIWRTTQFGSSLFSVKKMKVILKNLGRFFPSIV